jgi:hypothetical protein
VTVDLTGKLTDPQISYTPFLIAVPVSIALFGVAAVYIHRKQKAYLAATPVEERPETVAMPVWQSLLALVLTLGMFVVCGVMAVAMLHGIARTGAAETNGPIIQKLVKADGIALSDKDAARVADLRDGVTDDSRDPEDKPAFLTTKQDGRKQSFLASWDGKNTLNVVPVGEEIAATYEAAASSKD